MATLTKVLTITAKIMAFTPVAISKSPFLTSPATIKVIASVSANHEKKAVAYNPVSPQKAGIILAAADTNKKNKPNFKASVKEKGCDICALVSTSVLSFFLKNITKPKIPAIHPITSKGEATCFNISG